MIDRFCGEMTPPAVSQHLRVPLGVGLVTGKRHSEGKLAIVS